MPAHDLKLGHARIQEMAGQRKAFREKLEERKGLMIPSREDLGEAFPDQSAPGRKRDPLAAETGNPAISEDPGGRTAARRIA